MSGYNYVTHIEEKPTITCLCGSTRFANAFHLANLQLTMMGHIVLSIGCDMKSDAELFSDWNEHHLTALKQSLDELHLRKIDFADEVLMLNVGGYLGESSRRELAYAREHGKRIRWLEYCPDDYIAGEVIGGVQV